MVITAAEEKKSRVLSGMRPTGRLHIGHYFGALQKWVRLQNDPAYECFYFIADWHALESVKDKDLHNYGFLGYPVLQTADIVIYSKEGAPLLVPVGEDQVSHVELSREIVRRFDFFYGFSFDERLFDGVNRDLLSEACLSFHLFLSDSLCKSKRQLTPQERTETQAGLRHKI